VQREPLHRHVAATAHNEVMRLHKWLGWLAASLTLVWAGLELSAPHEPAVMAIVEDEYVTGAGYAAVSDQVASSSQTAILPGADDDSRGPARAAFFLGVWAPPPRRTAPLGFVRAALFLYAKPSPIRANLAHAAPRDP